MGVSSYPDSDLVSYAFHSLNPYDESQPLFIDAQDPTCALTATQMRCLVRTLVAGFQEHGIRAGESVLVHVGNTILYPAIYLAIIGAGGVFMGSNPMCQPDELDRALDLAEPRLILTERKNLASVLAASGQKGIAEKDVLVLDEAVVPDTLGFLGGNPPTVASSTTGNSSDSNFTDLLRHGERDWITFGADEESSRKTPAALFSTSGTSGLPKAAVHSHHAIISQQESMAFSVPYSPVRRLLTTPMFHLFSFHRSHFLTLRRGEPVYILPQFNLPRVLESIRQYEISEVCLVPSMVHMINQASASQKAVPEALQSVRFVGVASAAIDAHSMKRFHDLLHPDACVGQIWGMTEAGPIMQAPYRSRGSQYDLGSVGFVSPGYEARIVDAESGEILRVDSGNHSSSCVDTSSEDPSPPGVVHVRGPGLLTGYRSHEDSKDAEGWLSTGDVAYVKDGQYFLVGRTKELIKVHGYQVAPAEIEAVLMKHPGVKYAAVVGVKAADGSETPRAYVVRATPSPESADEPQVTADDLYEFSRQRLASYKALDGGVFFVESIPHTVSGKIHRTKLAEMNSQRSKLAMLLA